MFTLSKHKLSDYNGVSKVGLNKSYHGSNPRGLIFRTRLLSGFSLTSRSIQFIFFSDSNVCCVSLSAIAVGTGNLPSADSRRCAAAPQVHGSPERSTT